MHFKSHKAAMNFFQRSVGHYENVQVKLVEATSRRVLERLRSQSKNDS